MGTNFAVAPGEYLQEWIEGNGMSVGEFAVELGVSVAEIEDLLTGKEAIGREIACQLEQVTSIPSDSWIRFELKYREDSKRMSVGSEEPCTSSIHDELMGLFKQGGRSWVEVYALMEHVSEAELYRPEYNSFSAWLKDEAAYRRACCGTAKAQAISTRNGQTENQMSRVLRKENISLS